MLERKAIVGEFVTEQTEFYETCDDKIPRGENNPCCTFPVLKIQRKQAYEI